MLFYCWAVGGIYTVIRSKAQVTSEELGDQVLRLWGEASLGAPIASSVCVVKRSPFVFFFLPSCGNVHTCATARANTSHLRDLDPFMAEVKSAI